METQKWHIRVPRKEISYIRFLLEAYDGLAGLRTLDAAKGVLEISVPPGRLDEWRTLLDDMRRQFYLEVLHQ